MASSRDKFKEIWEEWGAVILVSASFVILPIIIVFFVELYQENSIRREEKRKMKEAALVRYQAKKDSIEREQERLLKQCFQQRQLFYIQFMEEYHLFSSYEEFDEWLYRANQAAMDLLYEVCSRRYMYFKSKWTQGEMQAYLFWGPPGYPTNCPRCDYDFVVEASY